METALERLVEVLEALLSLEERLDATALTGTRRPPRQEGELFFVYFFGGLECVDHSFDFVAHFLLEMSEFETRELP